MSTVALFVIQGIPVLRVFYMFSHSLVARCIIAFSYGAAIVSSITLLTLVLGGASLLTPLSVLAEVADLVGCPVQTETKFWHLYIPAFLLHTILYVFTLIRVLSCDDSPQALLIRRLHRDGGFFYLVVIAAVGYTEVGSGLFDHPGINIPAVFANFLLAATSISISRVMLSFRQLAEHIRNNPNRLGTVNSIPLSRVNWRKGSRDGEYLVTGSDQRSIPSFYRE
ncbi:hypothetical protein Hypma_005443 [Hypsizygus marmoreus]|uniref:Uncharacterized protein n=1 Tax=Hypsizygus marmoreus TaxID=39966 RepID=A0A369J1Q4_HYPMA|nr:hypothetical protein Hypma_005443 [Hypsizygus marmoreus]